MPGTQTIDVIDFFLIHAQKIFVSYRINLTFVANTYFPLSKGIRKDIRKKYLLETVKRAKEKGHEINRVAKYSYDIKFISNTHNSEE